MHNISNQDKSRIKSMLYFAKWRNRERKTPVPFDLTIEWALERWTGRCEITGLPFEVRKVGGPNPFSPSIDRINADNGYTQDNCRFVLFGINALKGNGSDEDVAGIAHALASRLCVQIHIGDLQSQLGDVVNPYPTSSPNSPKSMPASRSSTSPPV